MSRLQHKEYLTTGSWTCPAGVFKAWVWGYGGGGGGGGGRGGASSNATFSAAGGGGGGAAEAPIAPIEIDVVPGTVYTITIGAGAVGGYNGSGNAGYGGNGAAGGDTIFSDGVAVYRRFIGAHGGEGSDGNANPAGGVCVRPESSEDQLAGQGLAVIDGNPTLVILDAGVGGYGALKYAGYAAAPGMRGRIQRGTYDGTTGTRNLPGASGVDGAGYGGGGGGGGGNGPGGIGGAGGAGGASAYLTGFNGSNAADNTGAGGGGGGGGGYQKVAGSGGAGGKGRLVVSFIA